MNKEYEIALNNNEIAEGFVLRVSDFANEGTNIALIIRSSILYNLGYNIDYSKFRQYLLQDFFINKVFELSSVRFEVFERSNDPAVAPASILFYCYARGRNTDKNVVEHIALKPSRFFTLFKIFTINRTDYKKVEQKKLKEYDWLWKVMLYGSYFDFNFIKRLKKEYQPVKYLITDENRFIRGTGIQYSSKPTYDSKHLKGLHFINAYAIEPFFINPSKIEDFDKEKVHRIRNERLFKPPVLLIRKGIDTKLLKARSAICKSDMLYKDSLTGIKALNKVDVEILQKIEGILYSDLFSYLAINTFASIGIEREQTQNYDKFSVPFLNVNITKQINNIEESSINIYLEKQNILSDNFKIQKLKNNINNEINKINTAIFDYLNINDIESSIIDYAININLPFIVKDNFKIRKLISPIAFKDCYLEKYIYLFINRFKDSLVKNDKHKFIVEIWHTSKLIGMFFKVVQNNDSNFEKIIWKNGFNINQIIKFLIKLGIEKLPINYLFKKI